MDLTTRCPRCGAIFSASLEQLQLRKGYIRCVECANIFDGYEAVVPGNGASGVAKPAPAVAAAAPVAVASVAATPVRTEPVMPSVLRQRPAKEEPVPAVEPVVPKAAPQSGTGPAFSISAPARDTDAGHRQDPVFKVGNSVPERPDPVIHVPVRPDVAERPDPVVSAKSTPGSMYIDPRTSLHDDAPIPEFLGDEPRFRSAIRLFWGVLTIAGLLLLFAQLMYVYRAQIANQIPALRPVLTQACASLNCKVAYVRRIDQISIMSSSLKTTPGATDASGAMTLQLTLRNAYDKPQEWPTLVLDLTDFSGTVVIRKNLAPANYLPSEMLQHPFAASSEITVGVPIVLNDLKINGYQLGKFFP